MRQTFTAIFKRVTHQRLWTWDPSVLKVWLWLRLNADPEGDVSTTPTGVALQANVSDQQARAALALLESPDPDVDPEADPYQGRYLVRVTGGYHLVNFTVELDEVRAESKRARQRRYMARQRASLRATSSNDNSQSDNVGVEVDAEETPEPERLTNQDLNQDLPPKKEGSPLPPVIEAPRRVVRDLAEFVPTDEFRAEARIAGVLQLDDHLRRLGSGPIGGSRGVFAHQIEDYVRSFFGKWRSWEETDRSKAAGTRGAPAPEPQKPRPTVKGCPPWVHPDHAKIATEVALDVRKAAAAFARGYHLPVDSMRPADVFEPFRQFLLLNGERVAEVAQ